MPRSIVVSTASVTDRDVQKSVWAKADPACIVIALRLTDPNHIHHGLSINDSVGRRVPSHACGLRRIGEVDIEKTVVFIIGVKGQAKQPLFVAGTDAGHGQKRSPVDGTCFCVQNPNASCMLLDHVQPAGFPRRFGGEDWSQKSVSDPFQLKIGLSFRDAAVDQSGESNQAAQGCSKICVESACDHGLSLVLAMRRMRVGCQGRQ